MKCHRFRIPHSSPIIHHFSMTPLDYAPPPTSRPLTSIPLTIGLAIPTALLCLLCVVIVPRVESALMDFKTELPGLTKLMLPFSRWIANVYGWPLIWAAPLVIPIVVTNFFPPRDVPRRRWKGALLGVYIAWPL